MVPTTFQGKIVLKALPKAADRSQDKAQGEDPFGRGKTCIDLQNLQARLSQKLLL
jgi:hypothetical protein